MTLSHYLLNKFHWKTTLQFKHTNWIKTCVNKLLNPRSLLEKIVTRSLEGGINRTPPPSTFDTIHPIDLKFGTYSKLHLYFQLSETTWCLIGFHGNNSQINDVTFNYLFIISFFIIYLFIYLFTTFAEDGTQREQW